MISRSAALTFLVSALAVVAGTYVGTSLLGPLESAPSPTPAPTSSPTPAATLTPDALRVFPVGAIPADFRFVLVGDAGDERLLLLDLGNRTITLAAHFEGLGLVTKGRGVDLTSTPSGDRVVILLRSETEGSRLLVIRPSTGALRAFGLPRAEQPRLSPDGKRVALAQPSVEDPKNGIWIVDTDTGSETRLVSEDAAIVGSPPKPAAWSSDGRWLAVLPTLGPGGDEVAIVDTTSGETHFDPRRNTFVGGSARIVGPGQGARWRGQEVVHWSARSFIGGQDLLAVYDLATSASRRVFTPPSGRSIARAEVRAAGPEIATLESTATGSELWLRAGAQPDRMLLPQASAVIGYWWSGDGAHLYVWSNDNGTTTVVDALNNSATVVTFCLRQRIAPPCA